MLAAPNTSSPAASAIPIEGGDMRDIRQGTMAHLRLVSRGLDRPPSYALEKRPDLLGAGWRAASLFSGCGGLDLGMALAGVRTEYAYDNSRRATANHNFNLDGVARMADLFTSQPPIAGCEVLLAGAPCQGFSTAGKRRLDDPRNNLLARIGDFALAAGPRVVVVENVPAALSGTHGRHWVALEDRLRWHGYHVRRLTLIGNRMGLAQKRRRLWLVCWKGAGERRLEISGASQIDLRCALGGINPGELVDAETLETGTIHYAIACRIGPGQKLSNVRSGDRSVATWDIPEVFGHVSERERGVLTAVSRLRRRDRKRDHGDGDPVEAERLSRELGHECSALADGLVERGYLRALDGGFELRNTYNGKYRRLHWDGTSPTVDTHFGKPTIVLHPSEQRGMSVREALRIQGFPDWFELRAAREERYRMVGNAVPPPMARILGDFVREAILKA